METTDRHLTDAELFALAAPAAGEPEPLPVHLSRCADCSRALKDWTAALAQIGEDEAAPIENRSPERWNAAAESTMAGIRAAGRRGRPGRAARWALGIAATLLVVLLAAPWRQSADPEADRAASSGEAVLSAQDREDDELLRDVAYLSRGGDLAPDVLAGESL
jgi:hypothetical protein